MFCQNCGNKITENAAFCPKCGKKIIPEDNVQQKTKTTISEGLDKSSQLKQNICESDTTVGDTELLKILIGKNSEYYLKQFEKIERGEKSFNWYAFLFAPIVLLYRKQFDYFAKMLLPSYALLFIQMLIAGYATATLSLELMTIIPFIGLIIVVYAIVMSILCGKGFNKHYKTKLQTTIYEKQLRITDENAINKLKPSAWIPILFFIIYLVISSVLSFVVSNVVENSLLNGYNETSTLKTTNKQSTHKKTTLTSSEAKQVIQTWLETHEFPSSVYLTAEEGKRKFDGIESECYMFGLKGLSRIQTILVDSKTGELFINDGRIIPMEEWYQKYVVPYNKKNTDKDNKNANNYINKNFEWVEKASVKDGYIVGKIKNISNKDQFPSISFALYDYQGNQIGNASDTISDFKAGSIWSFRVLVNNARVTNYQFSGID